MQAETSSAPSIEEQRFIEASCVGRLERAEIAQ
jgi:hypothetical protein